MSRAPLHNFAGRTALVLHRSEEHRRRVVERCEVLGITAIAHRGDVDEALIEGVDMLIVDIDTGDDGQFPWHPSQSPVPIIGLVGSESPGRLGWALAQEVDAYLPLSALANLFSAMVIAHETFAQKSERREREARTAQQSGGRLDVIRAVLLLMEGTGGDEALALRQLRAIAMGEQMTLEDAARTVIAQQRQERAGKA